MGEITFWKRLAIRIRQMFCPHHVFVVHEIHKTKKEIGYEIWCEHCHGINKQFFIQIESEE
jgi:N-formylglutamate amidohydrolase